MNGLARSINLRPLQDLRRLLRRRRPGTGSRCNRFSNSRSSPRVIVSSSSASSRSFIKSSSRASSSSSSLSSRSTARTANASDSNKTIVYPRQHHRHRHSDSIELVTRVLRPVPPQAAAFLRYHRNAAQHDPLLCAPALRGPLSPAPRHCALSPRPKFNPRPSRGARERPSGCDFAHASVATRLS